METTLREGLAALGLSDAAVPALTTYAQLLLEKNKVMNLTRITEGKSVATLHFLDSLALCKLVDFSGKRVIDVGTGAGFPGLPLRILDPSIQLTLLDALGKRVTFLQEVCDQLHLTDVQCVHGRAEEFAGEHREAYDVVISRAVAPLPLLAELCLPLIRVGGTFVAMKSVDSDDEIYGAAKAIALLGGQAAAIQDYTIPGTDVSHRAVLVTKSGATPPKYPRAFAKIKKNPLS